MSVLPLLTAFLALQGGGAKPKFSIDVYLMQGKSPVAVKGGESLTGEVTFVIKPITTNPIQAIEMYVGDDLRETDGSTPYEFKLDSLSEEDGPIKLRFKGFTSEGENAEKLVTLNVDNGVSLGADAHVAKGNAYLAESKFDEALTEGRIALKADKDSVAARLLLGRANFAKGAYDKAQKNAEDVLEVDKKNRDARELIISLNVQKAFSATSKATTDRRETVDAIKKSLMNAAKMRTAIRDEDLDGMKRDGTSIEFLDAAIKARRYALVVDSLEKEIPNQYKRTDLVNRLVFSYLMLSRVNQADGLLKNLKKFGEYDAYSFALLAVNQAELGDDNGSDEAIKEAILNSPDSLGVKTAQAYIAIKRDRAKALADAASALLRDGEVRSEAYYFAAALANRLTQINKGRANFEKAIRADAADHDMYVEQGNEAISLALTPNLTAADKDYQFEFAKAMYSTALECRPSSGQALAGIGIASLYQKKFDDAVKFTEAATKASPNYAAAFYASAAALAAKDGELAKAYTAVVNGLTKDPGNDAYRKQKSAIESLRPALLKSRTNAMLRAEGLDARNLKGRSTPTVDNVFKYFNTTGRTPVISTPARG
ncbi:MAG: hypothetical protein WCK51_01165 [Armatimonadota bacterium]